VRSKSISPRAELALAIPFVAVIVGRIESTFPRKNASRGCFSLEAFATHRGPDLV
jgi:hypothetical protein